MQAIARDSLPVAETWFVRERLADGVTWLSEPHVDPFARCNIWHVRGRDRDVVIDTGLGLRALREVAADLLQREVAAVLTHSHFDHVGGAHEFEERIGHTSELAELAQPRGFCGLSTAALGDELVASLRRAGYDPPEQFLTALPHAGYDPADYRVERAPLTRTVVDGDRIDLGDRSFEVLHLPGHSAGSIALFERASGLLFSGDAVYDGPLLYELPGSSIEDYVRSLERLLALEVSTVHAGHDPSFGRERLHQIAREYLTRFRA